MVERTARVGIVVRTKNRPEFLARTFADIAAQSYDGWKVVVVNDGGSPREVARTVEGAPARTRDRVEVIDNPVATGRSAAANSGVDRSGTEFVVLHDDDDLWHPDFLARTVEWLDAHPDAAGVMTRTEIVYEAFREGRLVEVGRAPFWRDQVDITYSALLQSNRAVPISYLYRRRIHDEVGLYREDLHAVEDWEFNLRVAARFPIGFVNETLAYWMQRTGVSGELGNSMFTLADEHDLYDRQVRDEALRAYVRENGAGLPLYLTRFIQEEIARQLTRDRSLGARAVDALRAWRDRRRR